MQTLAGELARLSEKHGQQLAVLTRSISFPMKLAAPTCSKPQILTKPGALAFQKAESPPVQTRQLTPGAEQPSALCCHPRSSRLSSQEPQADLRLLFTEQRSELLVSSLRTRGILPLTASINPDQGEDRLIARNDRVVLPYCIQFRTFKMSFLCAMYRFFLCALYAICSFLIIRQLQTRFFGRLLNAHGATLRVVQISLSRYLDLLVNGQAVRLTKRELIGREAGDCGKKPA